MSTKRRSFESGHKRKYLVVIDDTEECDRAVYWAAKRAGRSRMVMSGEHSRPESANDSLGATNLAVMDDARQAPSQEARAP